MTRKDYIKMRQKGEFNVELLYKFYVVRYDELKEAKNYKRMLGFQEFNQLFTMVFSNTNKDVVSHLDNYFDVTIVQGKLVEGSRKTIYAF